MQVLEQSVVVFSQNYFANIAVAANI